MPAVDLIEQAEFALDDEFDEGDLAVVEMGQINTGVEDTFAGIFRMLQYAATQHADLDAVVEQNEVDGGLHRRHGVVVLGVEKGMIAVGDGSDIAFTFDSGVADRHPAGTLEFRKELFRLALWQQHGVDKMHAAALRRRERARRKGPGRSQVLPSRSVS